MAANPQRILLQIPTASFAYMNIAFPMRRSFQKHGIESHIQSAGLTPDAELALLSNFKPDVLLAINGIKTDICRQFPNMRYVNWILDNNFLGQDMCKIYADHNENDLFYLIDERLRNVMEIGANNLLGKLLFATEPVEPGSPIAARQSTFSLVAYIPPASMLDHQYRLPNGKIFSARDYFHFYGLAMAGSVEHPLEMLDEIIRTFLAIYHTTPEVFLPEQLMFFKEEYIRASNRYRLARHILDLGYDCRFFGPQDWLSWADLAPHYCGEAPTTEQVREIYQSSTINLHNGGIITHPRVLDCMGSHGGILLSNRFSYMDPDNEFEPGVHYVEADLPDMADTVRYYLENHEARQAMSDRAYAYICAHHTWDHRIVEILNDLKV